MDYLARLAQDANPWKRNRVSDMLSRVTKEYALLGYQVVGEDSTDKLQATKNPHDDLERLNLGYGVELRAPCGCQWHINTKGSIVQTVHCPDNDCTGRPPGPLPSTPTEKPKYERVYYLYEPHEVVNKSCACGAHLIENVRIERTFRDGSAKLIVEQSCPHHGLKGNPWTVTAPPERLVRTKG